MWRVCDQSHFKRKKAKGTHQVGWLNYLDFVEHIGFNVVGEAIWHWVIKVKYVFMENKKDKIWEADGGGRELHVETIKSLYHIIYGCPFLNFECNMNLSLCHMLFHRHFSTKICMCASTELDATYACYLHYNLLSTITISHYNSLFGINIVSFIFKWRDKTCRFYFILQRKA